VSIGWVRRQYGVPARRGGIVKFEGRPAVILSATNYLHVRFTDDQKPAYGYLHPTWHVEYDVQLPTEVPEQP
jgi:hypothetical protein